jgi:hypothetical protein
MSEAAHYSRYQTCHLRSFPIRAPEERTPRLRLVKPVAPAICKDFDNTAQMWALPTTQELVSHAKAAVPAARIPAQRNSFFLPPARAAPVVHRAGEVALRNHRMKTVAQRLQRRQYQDTPCRRVAATQ